MLSALFGLLYLISLVLLGYSVIRSLFGKYRGTRFFPLISFRWVLWLIIAAGQVSYVSEGWWHILVAALALWCSWSDYKSYQKFAEARDAEKAAEVE